MTKMLTDTLSEPGVRNMVEIQAGGVYRSYSSFQNFLQCGKAWQLSREARAVEQPAWWFAGGKAVHTATEVYDNALFAAEAR